MPRDSAHVVSTCMFMHQLIDDFLPTFYFLRKAFERLALFRGIHSYLDVLLSKNLKGFVQ